MDTTLVGLRRRFHDLHRQGCFVLPNPWDVGSALALQSLGFEALASTSSGMAWSLGRPDNGVRLEAVLTHLQALVEAVDIPVNADFEDGFAVAPEAMAANVTRAVGTGVAGLSIEDSSGDPDNPLFEFSLAVERIAAARAAIDATGSNVLLTARSEGFFVGRPDLDETLKRLVAFAAAGADCLYAPGIRSEEEISSVIQAVAPKPVNVLAFGQPASQLAALGVRRISLGGALARAAWGEFLRTAREIAEEGRFERLDQAARGADLNDLFADRRQR